MARVNGSIGNDSIENDSIGNDGSLAVEIFVSYGYNSWTVAYMAMSSGELFVTLH